MEAKHWLLVIVVLSFAARVPYVLAEAPLDWDAAAYAANSDWFQGNRYYFEELRAPLLPLLLIPFGLSGIMEWAPVVFGVLSILAAFLLFKEIAGEEKALVATAILAMSGLLYSWTTQISVESLSVFVLSLTFLFFVRAVKNRKWLVPAFAAAGFAILLRYYFFIALVLGVAYYYWETRRTDFAKPFALLVLLLLPWAAFNFAEFGDPLFSLTESISVFSGDSPNYRPIGFYLENWWQLADIVTWALLALGLAQYKKFSRPEWLLAAWLVLNVVLVHLTGVKEPRYFVPMLLPIAYFAAKPLQNKRFQAIALLLIAIAGLTVASYAVMVHAPNECSHHTGMALASQTVEGTICSTHWTITAYQSKQPVEKLWYGRNVDECIAGADWLVYSNNWDPGLSKELLDARGDLRFAGSFGPECSEAFLYKIIKN